MRDIEPRPSSRCTCGAGFRYTSSLDSLPEERQLALRTAHLRNHLHVGNYLSTTNYLGTKVRIYKEFFSDNIDTRPTTPPPPACVYTIARSSWPQSLTRFPR